MTTIYAVIKAIYWIEIAFALLCGIVVGALIVGAMMERRTAKGVLRASLLITVMTSLLTIFALIGQPILVSSTTSEISQPLVTLLEWPGGEVLYCFLLGGFVVVGILGDAYLFIGVCKQIDPSTPLRHFVRPTLGWLMGLVAALAWSTVSYGVHAKIYIQPTVMTINTSSNVVLMTLVISTVIATLSMVFFFCYCTVNVFFAFQKRIKEFALKTVIKDYTSIREVFIYFLSIIFFIITGLTIYGQAQNGFIIPWLTHLCMILIGLYGPVTNVLLVMLVKVLKRRFMKQWHKAMTGLRYGKSPAPTGVMLVRRAKTETTTHSATTN